MIDLMMAGNNTILEAMRIIGEVAPRIELKKIYFSNPDELFIDINGIEENAAYTFGNIYEDQTCSISLSNDWIYHRQGTALHEFMHALGFEHEHCRNDRDYFVYVQENDIDNEEEKRQYSITRFSQELTIFDPFSVMLYSESNRIERDPRSRLWKLK